ncbi:MAG: aldo/keto reductase [Thermoleophilia bacterium]|nr:aldo/keto reductase [Thermoleophilia bacterium]
MVGEFALPSDPHAPYLAGDDRYTKLEYRRVGSTGLLLPPISLGLWYNFGDNIAFDRQREILRAAFDAGVTHFDLANNYGPPAGAAEENFGRVMRKDFAPYRNQLVISTKAGWDQYPGPYGQLGSRKYLLASLDESLLRMGLDHVDIFYSHRPDPHTPLEETIGALDSAVRAGKARYAGISSYSPDRTRTAARIARELGTPLAIHQPSYSMLNRWIEEELLDTLAAEGMGCITFTALAQGLLTDRYLGGAAGVERSTKRPTLADAAVTPELVTHLQGLSEIARGRDQSLAQLALSWVLRQPHVTSTLVGVSSLEQLQQNLAALDAPSFHADELRAIDEHARESGIDIWRSVSGS